MKNVAVFCPLFSGSSGNCEYIGYGDSGILIDAGVSAKRIISAMSANGFNPSSVKAIFITHEHTDHICGLRVFAAKYHIPVFCSYQTKNALNTDEKIRSSLFINDFADSIEIGGFTVNRFNTSHDCLGSSGYKITTPDCKIIAVCTDLGYVSDEVRSSLLGCNAVMLESNHDLSMLRNGPYPISLKKRIASDTGHLSNNCCAELLPELVKSGTTRIILGHLSKENNRPKLAYETAEENLSVYGFKADVDYSLQVASPENGKPIVI